MVVLPFLFLFRKRVGLMDLYIIYVGLWASDMEPDSEVMSALYFVELLQHNSYKQVVNLLL